MNKIIVHKTKQSDINKFYESMYGIKTIKSEKEKQDMEAWYFALCLLLPKTAFLQMVELHGGLENVLLDYTKIKYIAKHWRVEPILVKIRIRDLLSQESKNKEQTENNNIKKLIKI